VQQPALHKVAAAAAMAEVLSCPKVVPLSHGRRPSALGQRRQVHQHHTYSSAPSNCTTSAAVHNAAAAPTITMALKVIASSSSSSSEAVLQISRCLQSVRTQDVHAFSMFPLPGVERFNMYLGVACCLSYAITT